MRQYLAVVFGGTFDPVHFGHIKPLRELSRNLPTSQIRFLPCYRQTCKWPVAGSVHRLAMLQLIAEPPRCVVDTRELDKQDICYTVDTLAGLREELGSGTPICFVLGQDAFARIETWKLYGQIPELAHLIVISRPGNEMPGSHPLVKRCSGWSTLATLYDAPAGKLCWFRNQQIAVSSSEVRACLSNGKQPRYLLPGTVWNYIRRHKLYTAAN